MSTVTDLQQKLDVLENTLKSIQLSITQIEKDLKEETEATDFDVFIQNEIEPLFGTITSEGIVKKLQECRRNKCYNAFCSVYQWKSIYGDIKKRQALKLISAVYRVRYLKTPVVYALKSEIKYATSCPHCGSMAKALHLRLIKEGYMTA